LEKGIIISVDDIETINAENLMLNFGRKVVPGRHVHHVVCLIDENERLAMIEKKRLLTCHVSKNAREMHTK